MKRLFYRSFCPIIICCLLSMMGKAQAGLCPPNMDFEMGSFANWVCRSGNVSAPNNVNTVTLPNIGQSFNQHQIISAANATTDQYGNFPTICPNGSGYSVKLGNNVGGAQAESISYTYTIPSTLSTFSLMFHYAIVLQDPNHLPFQQPRFRAAIKDLSTFNPIQCVDFDFTASASLPGFQASPVAGVIYKDWTPVTINLSAYIGRTIELEFITSDCTFQAHFGYAYIDVNSNCNGAIAGTNICAGDNSVTLTAPYGFMNYAWYSDNGFGSLISSSQTLPLDPAPSVGTIIPVIVTPFPGFGCTDTLYATIGVAPKPVSIAGPDISECQSLQTQIGGPPTAGYNYLWTPASQVNFATISNPMAWNIPPNPTRFIVKTTDLLTGCFSYDTTYVTTGQVDTAVTTIGTSAFCPGGSLPSFSVNSIASPIQWYNGNTAIPGATTPVFVAPSPGNYWAQLTMNGCTDSTAIIPVFIRPVPIPSFTPSSDSLCITNNSFQFSNSSTVSDNSTLSYNWKFSDGSTQQVVDATKTFANPGAYRVELVATSAYGCKDSTRSDVYVLPNGIPDFNFDSICINRPIQFRNLSNENGAVSVGYSWNFNNGSPLSTIKNPLPVSFSTAGPVNVTLQMTTLGCTASPVSITKTVNVHTAGDGIRYPDLTVPQGSSKFIRIRDVSGTYAWSPRVHLSSYNSRHAEFYATGDDVLYHIEITDKHSCITTDTMLVQVLKKPGYYVPTAFSPNGDGLNDVARPYLVAMKSLKSFSIYNRWGDRIFFTTTYGDGWNGKFKGQDQNPGVYVWILEFFDNNNKLVAEKGTIAIVR